MDSEYTANDHSFRENDSYAQAKYDITLRWLKAKNFSNKPVLYNIGCGNGLFNTMAVNAGYEVRSFEPDSEAFKIAVETSPSIDCSIEPLGLFGIEGENVADVIVMHDVLEHIGDDKTSVEKLATLLKPGGVLVLSVPALQILFGLHDEQLGHYARYSKRRLRKIFKKDFDIEALRYFGMSFIPITAWFSKIRRKPYPTGTANSSLVGNIFKSLCRIESRVPAPIGTSLIIRAKLK